MNFHTLFLIISLVGILLGNMGRITFFNGLVVTYIYEICIIIHLCTLIYFYRLKPLHFGLSKFKSLNYLFLVFISSFILSMPVFSLYENTLAILYLVRFITYILYFLYLNYVYNSQIIRVENKYITYSLYILSFISILQYFLFPKLDFLANGGWDPHAYRVYITYFDTSAAAAIIGISLFYTIIKKNYLLTTLLTVLLLFTYSRAGVIAFFITVVLTYVHTFINKNWLTLDRIQLKLFIMSFIVLIIGQLLLSFTPKKANEQGTSITRTGSVYSRTDDYKEGIRLFFEKPILGYGYNHIRSIKNQPSTNNKNINHAGASFHSTFLIILVSSGIVGFITYIWFLYELWSINILSKILLPFLCIMSLFDNILLYPVILMYTYIIITSFHVKDVAYPEANVHG